VLGLCFACGTAGHLRHLRESYDVIGVDVDPGMLAVARQSLPDVELIEADMRSLALNATFDAVVCLFSSIGYMRDVGELHAAVSGMARHLNPRGVLIVDGWVRPDAWLGPGTTHVDLAEGDKVKIVRVSRSQRDGNQTYLEMHHLVATLDSIEHIVDEHHLTLFTREEYEEAFTMARLTVDVLASPMPDRDRFVGQVTE
jgi:SAM-dependent methyltransferase